jgi:phosphotransferase system HPr-like phosphotransfer protein
MGIMMLEAGCGSKVIMVANGDDAQRAVDELEALLVNENIDNVVM